MSTNSSNADESGESKAAIAQARIRKFYQGLSSKHKQLVKRLTVLGQGHLFDKLADSSPTIRRQFVEQLVGLDESYSDGGLEAYIKKARELLEQSRLGINPLDGWEPSIPTGETFEIGTREYKRTESVGIKELGNVGFVLVAGGLGERLGYSGIKLALPTEMATETCYLQFYIEYILAVEKKYAYVGRKLPLCIMTSADTNERTLSLLEKNNYFGMGKEQVTIVQQGQGVPALVDNSASFVLDPSNPAKLLTKPHGHGDIHMLLHNHGIAKEWYAEGLKWLTIFQDTNGLALHTLPLMLGVSKNLDLIMNSLAVPRKAKQAIGGIMRLKNKKTGDVRTVNVEYNQLDPLLRANGQEEGDVNDTQTGFSPYPGNINQLLFKLKPYKDILFQTKGLMPEFVNPKYKDAEKKAFKKPTRLECMMQDFPTVLKGEDAERAGFTSISADLCFSPVKNATGDGARLQANGTHPGTAASGEADQYAAVRKIMNSMGMSVEDEDAETFNDITVVPGPMIVLKPNFVCCPGEFKKKFPNPERIKIHAGSTLIVRGSDVVIESLNLKGCLVIDVEDGEKLTISEKIVRNDGWVRVRDKTTKDEIIRMRGYRIDRKDSEWIEVTKEEPITGFCYLI